MKRRGFLGLLIALPAASKQIIKEAASSPELIKSSGEVLMNLDERFTLKISEEHYKDMMDRLERHLVHSLVQERKGEEILFSDGSYIKTYSDGRPSDIRISRPTNISRYTLPDKLSDKVVKEFYDYVEGKV